MKTPICDFVKSYAERKTLRLHMPGHKGKSIIGAEELDITEIDGADELYAADGVIRKSEMNAGELFGARTFYSAEGSSLSIRAMLYLTVLYAKSRGKEKTIVATGRNAHKVFLTGAALLDIDIKWIFGKPGESYLSCSPDPSDVDAMLQDARGSIDAVYITSPDYLGNTAQIRKIADVCHAHGALLLVDNAHGAYLKFLDPSLHPMDLGADICCDSAHKTLPALTGAAYLHISHNAPPILGDNAKTALSIFGSTSPSYLILQSLDALNAYLASGYSEALAKFICVLDRCKRNLEDGGYTLLSGEPLKITVCAPLYGYTGHELAFVMSESGIVCEFHDRDHVVLMPTVQTGDDGLARLVETMLSIPKKRAIDHSPPIMPIPEFVLSARQALLSPCETVNTHESVGRILASPTVSCPPAVPIVACGERITEDALTCFDYYGITRCTVVK